MPVSSAMRYTSHSRTTRRPSRNTAGCKRSFDASDSSEHSSDSGLGLDHHLAEVQLATRSHYKRVALPFENSVDDDVNDEYCFPTATSIMPGTGRGVAVNSTTPQVPLSATLPHATRDGRVSLAIICQPEQQHRARYQTEGSRGAVKDRTGHGFPVVKLSGYNKPTTLQIFVGTDVGRVAPHMFYQACRVSGKNSTPCVERKIDGTVVIEVDLDASKDMIVTCDCVGILKERNVDVEHRFPEQSAARNKKKSTRCRLVFRACVTNADGICEVLQVCSQPIVCTQPPGVPEINKRSCNSCPATGGAEIIILGKNFLKDTKVVFQDARLHSNWEETVTPDKEFLQQNHLVCIVPPYRSEIHEPVAVKLFVVSGGKTSDPQTFLYLPSTTSEQLVPTSPANQPPCPYYMDAAAYINGDGMLPNGCTVNVAGPSPKSSSPLSSSSSSSMLSPLVRPSSFDLKSPSCWKDETVIMPPPIALVPLASTPQLDELKAELEDELSQHSVVMETDSEISQSPDSHQGVDLTLKPVNLLTPNINSLPEMALNALSFMKVTKPEFPVLYENVSSPSYMEDTLLQPPPNKIFFENSPVMSPRPRSGSFSDDRVSALEMFSRNRSASMSSSQHVFSSRGKLLPPRSPQISNLAPLVMDKSIVGAAGINGMVKDVVQDTLQTGFFPTTTPTLPQSQSNAPTGGPVSTTGLLDALVNSAADTHINPLLVSSAAVPVPVTVSEINRSVMADLPGVSISQPVNSMVPQEITKMTESDLISYINPSCFDQV